MSSVPFHSSIPLYHQIAKALQQRAAAGRLGPRGEIATEGALCDEFGVSRSTIRQALGVLKQSGILRSRRGVGTTLLAAVPQRTLTRSHGDPLHGALGSEPRIVELGRAVPPAAVANFLGLAEDSNAFRLVRVHDLDRTPLSVVISWLPPALARGVTRSALRKRSLHDLLQKTSGRALKRSLHSIRVARTDARIASLLGIALTDPVLYIQSCAYFADGSPARWTDNYFVEDRYQYTAEMQWPRPGRRK